MGKTIVGLYDGPMTAERVIAELEDAGFAGDQVRVVRREDFSEQPKRETDILGISGMAKPEVGEFEEAVRRGGTVVAVTADEERSNRVRLLMEQHAPIDVEQLAAQWRVAGWENPYGGRSTEMKHPSDKIDANTQVGRERSSLGVRVFVW